MVRRALTENVGLKLLALSLAVILVYVQARKKIDQKEFKNVLVAASNIPENMVLAVPERTYSTNIILQGPQNVLEWLNPKDLRFTLDLSRQSEWIQSRQWRIRLGPEHFKPNLEERERKQVTLSPEDTRPSEVLVTVHPYNIAEKEPPAVYASQDPKEVIEIPLYQLTKDVPVHVLTEGAPPEGYTLAVKSTPQAVTLTGPKAALDRIGEVTTTPINVTSQIRSATTEVSLPELARGDSPVSATTTRVTVRLIITRRKGGT